MENIIAVILVLPFLWLAFWLYFLPTAIARRRHHPASGKIFALNLLLGLSGWGWLLALIWATSHPRLPVDPDRAQVGPLPRRGSIR